MWRCPRCDEELPDGIAACWICGTLADGTVDPDFVAEKPPAKQPPAAVAVPGLPAPGPGAARQLWIEMLVVAAIAVLPDLWWSIASFCWEYPRPGATAESLAVCIRSITVSAVVLYLLWRSGHPWQCFGLSKPRASDLLAGVLVALAVGVARHVILTLIWQPLPGEWKEILGLRFELAVPQSSAGWIPVVVAQLANGFAEELAMRGYLLLRLRQLLGSSTGALLLSSVLFASYHLYQGPWGCLSSFVYGVLIGLAFLRIRRLWPVALAHALGNLNIIVSSSLS